MGLVKQWKVKGTLLGPLHIGSGETLDPFRCAYKDGALFEYDLSAALAQATETQRSRLAQRLESPIQNEQQADEVLRLLWELPWEDCILKKYELDNDLKITFDRDLLVALRTAEIHTNSFNSLTGDRIIPGSSLKGALRTGVVAAESVRRSVSPKEQRNSRELEKYLLNYSKIEEDPFGEWKVADAILHGKSRITGSVRYYREEKKDPVINSGQYFEFMPKGSTFETIVTFRRREGVPNLARIAVDDEYPVSLINATNSSTLRAFKDAYDAELPKFPKETDYHITEIEDELTEVQQSKNICITRIGRFSGFLFLTVGPQRVLPEHRGHRPELYEEKANPITRTIATNEQLFGFVRLEFTAL